MKRFRLFALAGLAALLLFSGLSAKAQVPIFPTMININTGLSNSPVFSTNIFAGMNVRQITGFTINLTNFTTSISNNVVLSLNGTNNTVIIGQLVITPAMCTQTIITPGSITNFSFTTNFPPYQTNIPCNVSFNMNVGTNIVGVVPPNYGPPNP